ncbi:hypothetical protein LTR93_008330 [Exophiala xenobiotica]|nr:hypothetical protein LTR93_008330 [Exophiala xenobiotica]KAK5405041.1 hypothetical protein LTR06_009308 [Exophiala xenobiotica]
MYRSCLFDQDYRSRSILYTSAPSGHINLKDGVDSTNRAAEINEPSHDSYLDAGISHLSLIAPSSTYAYVPDTFPAPIEPHTLVMPRGPPPILILISAVALFVWYVVWTAGPPRDMSAFSYSDKIQDKIKSKFPQQTLPAVETEVVHGEHVMGKLGNETLKAELGRAAWKVLHTTMARFPDKPTDDEQDALKNYLFLFARLYPCGECAEHFQAILKKYPPQTSSRSSAAAWTCFVHNLVNESKGKPIFDCANIGDFYDCGCADDEKEAISAAGAKSSAIAQGKPASHEAVEIEVEGPTRGG